MLAAEYGHANIVALLLEKGAKVAAAKGKPSALCYAAEYGHLDVVKQLVAAGADVSHAEYDKSALHWAAEFGHLPVVEFLIENGAKISARTQLTRLSAADLARICGHEAVAERLEALSAAADSDAEGDLEEDTTVH